MSDLKLLISSRKFVRKAITETHNKRDSFSALSRTDRNAKKSLLQDFLVQLRDYDSRIQSLKWTETEDESVLEEEISLSHEYLSKIKECLSLLEDYSPPFLSNSSVDSARSLLKSPIAPLPKFTSGEEEDLNRFFLQFEETISKFSYPDYDKFLLLKQQVSGRASILLNSLEADRQSYAHAKELLTTALASPETQRFSIIRQLSEMKLSVDSDPFEYISKMKYIMEGVKKFNMDADAFLQYFFWTGMNDLFQSQLIQITNHSKPSLKEITDKFFEACERYQNLQKHSKDRKKKANSVAADSAGSNSNGSTTGFAVKVDYKTKSPRPCSICTKVEGKDVSHPIYKCPTFQTPQDKINKLSNLSGCIKCANFSHTEDNCRFRFRSPCTKCRGWHMTYLCDKNTSQAEKEHVPDKQETVSKPKPIQSRDKEKSKKGSSSSNLIALTEAFHSDIDGESILPTFICEIGNIKVRGLKDGGCQSNLISEKLASELNLKVIRITFPSL